MRLGTLAKAIVKGAQKARRVRRNVRAVIDVADALCAFAERLDPQPKPTVLVSVQRPQPAAPPTPAPTPKPPSGKAHPARGVVVGTPDPEGWREAAKRALRGKP